MDNKTSRKKSSKADRAEFASELNADISKTKKNDQNSQNDHTSDCH